MKTFLISLQAEFLKIRRSSAFWLVIIAGAFLPSLFFIMFVSKPDVFEPRLAKDAWAGLINMAFQGASFFLLPMFVVLVASLVTQIEFRNGTWKQVMASPLKVGDIYFAKYIVIQCMLMVGYLFFNGWMLLMGELTQLFRSGYHFNNTPVPWKSLLIMDGKFYIGILGMSTIQYCLSLRLKNFIGAIGVGLALIIAGLMMLPWDKVVYFPYAYSGLSFIRSGFKNFQLLKHEYWSLAYFAVFLILGYADFRFRRERG